MRDLCGISQLRSGTQKLITSSVNTTITAVYRNFNIGLSYGKVGNLFYLGRTVMCHVAPKKCFYETFSIMI